MIYQIHGCSVEMSSGMQTAKVRRLDTGEEKEFRTKVEQRDGEDVCIHAQEQAHLWAREAPEAEEPTDLDGGAE